MFKIVQTSSPPGAPLEQERKGLAEFADGLVSYGNLTTPEQLIEHCHDADALLVPGAHFTREVIDHLEHCRVLVRYGVGYDTIDVPAASDHNLVVVNIPDFCLPEVANHALALLLDCAKKITRQDRWIRTGAWGDRGTGSRAPFLSPMGPIHGETVGLVGFGQIAREFHRRLIPLDVRVIAYDPYVPAERVAALGVEMVSLEDVMRQSDYISIHTPLLPDTHHMINAAMIALMKPTAYLINTSRGPVVDEAALIAALQGGRIAGAGLDVFEVEPLAKDSPLMAMENVVLVPHTASYADVTFAIMHRRVGEEAARALRGQMPNTPVNPQIKPRLTWLNE
ncbi:MAG: C-terminal binding protein [Thermomicrobiales bacterium]